MKKAEKAAIVFVPIPASGIEGELKGRPNTTQFNAKQPKRRKRGKKHAPDAMRV